MTHLADAGQSRRARRAKSRARSGATFIGVLGELFLTVGVLALLFVAWQLWIGDWIGAAQKNAVGSSISQQWAAEFDTPPASTPTATPDPTVSATPDPAAEPVILPEAKNGKVFGVMYIPRFGKDYQVPMAGGVTRPVTLDPIGIGHYPGTPMPGAKGNVSLAAHRTTYGKPFNKIAKLRLNDPIIIETKAGWYVYRFRNLEYVKPSAVDVLLPVPQEKDVKADGRYLTMTSCSPMYWKSERIVAYSVFESFTPRADGPPDVLEGVK
ncbi:class E sortase [Microbacterium horticulturae]|uniref:Class E sortase n=1 Tax=Microbacterium horticulturae TaxID=3028316 RepID=A0ABY8C2A9_9MICO|nr:class E sortase [Microbacterium sp. KACC 23027]WEG08983.1 class E sortase [Microbacterium sp. KACC 23027]